MRCECYEHMMEECICEPTPKCPKCKSNDEVYEDINSVGKCNDCGYIDYIQVFVYWQE